MSYIDCIISFKFYIAALKSDWVRRTKLFENSTVGQKGINKYSKELRIFKHIYDRMKYQQVFENSKRIISYDLVYLYIFFICGYILQKQRRNITFANFRFGPYVIRLQLFSAQQHVHHSCSRSGKYTSDSKRDKFCCA